MSRRVHSVSSFVVVVAAATALVAASSPSADSTPDMTRQELAKRLDRAGLRITYREPHVRDSGTEALGGVAAIPGGGRVGFEFVIDADGEASTTQLGTVGFPLKFPKRGPVIDPIIRGVLRKVAYANFFLGNGSGDRQDMRVVHRLDDALFGAFPPDDAQVHPILDTPPE